MAASVRIRLSVMPFAASASDRPGRPPGHVAPDRLAGGHQRRVGQAHPERLGHDLRRRRGAQELAAAARAGAGAAAQLGGLLEAQLAVRVAGPDRLDLARVLAVARAAA